MLIGKRVLDGICAESKDLGHIIPSSTGLTGLTYSESQELDIVREGEATGFIKDGEHFNVSATRILTVKAIIEAVEVLNNEREESIYKS